MPSDNYNQKYTKPDLRRELKEEIKQSDKGGEPGQWSARKSQLLVQEYEKHGGGYKHDQKDEAAKSLEEWTEQNWQTKEGEGPARSGEMTKRYLPEEVWDKLSENEKREAEQTKKKGSKSGDQYVSWTPAIKRAMKEAGYAPDDENDESKAQKDEPTQHELYEQAQELEISGRSKMSKEELQEAIAHAQPEQLHKQTRDELYEKARELNIDGRSKMSKNELVDAISNTRNQ